MDRLGISIGDIVTTSYHTGPYVVHGVYGPFYTERGFYGLVVRTWPVYDLGLDGGGINSVRREGERWFTDSNDEIFVQFVEPEGQLSLFEVCEQPVASYPLEPGVDYRQFGRVWKCGRCEVDFNAAPPQPYWRGAACPRCGLGSYTQVYLMPPRVAELQQLNAYVLGLSSPQVLAAEWGKIAQSL